MRSDSGKVVSFINNTDIRGEFEKIFKDPNSLSYWKNYIRRRLKFSLISKYERITTAEDILSMLQMKIYDKNLEWNRNIYKNFKHFMYGKIQNIIRNKETSLAIRYENYLKDEESGEKIYDAKPMTFPETDEGSVEINIERIDKELNEGDDKEFDHDKFREIVRDLLKDVKYTDLLAIFNGLMENKEPKEIWVEYGLSECEYHNSYRRLLYKLRRELPVEYKEMFSQ